MKKLIITAICATAAVSGFSQGTVAFANGGTSAIYFGTNALANKATSATIGSQTGTASTGVVDVGLFWSTSQFNTIAGGTLAGIANMTTTAGVFTQQSVFAVTGTNPNDVDFFQLFAWDSSYGNDHAGAEAALAARGYFGAATAGATNSSYGAIGSALSVKLGATAGPGTPIFGTLTSEFGKTIILAGPEPATIAIGGLGAAALLLFRRRK